jgi:hypothetical protein
MPVSRASAPQLPPAPPAKVRPRDPSVARDPSARRIRGGRGGYGAAMPARQVATLLTVAGLAAAAIPATATAATARPVDCGPTSSGTYRMHASRTTSCAFARATYAAFARDLNAGRELVSAVPARYRIQVRNPSTKRLITLRVHAIPRAHGEFEFSFVAPTKGKSIFFENLTLP